MTEPISLSRSDEAKRRVEDILSDALSGTNPCYRFEQQYIRWGVVQDEINAVIDSLASEKEDPMLPLLCKALGWQGGTIHQALAEVARLRATSVPTDKITSVARSFEHIGGDVHVPWVKVTFPNADWESRDAFAAAVRPKEAE